MKPIFIFTIGKNPLPVVVAARRFGCPDAKARAAALCSHNTLKEYAEIRKLTGEYVDWQQEATVDPYIPARIELGIGELMDRACDSDVVHLHYSGGTKAMGVHALRKLAEIGHDRGKLNHGFALHASYLDPRRHRIHCWGEGAPTAESDERKRGWHLTPEELVELHGMVVHAPKPQDAPWNIASALFNEVLANQEVFKKWHRTLRDRLRDAKPPIFQEPLDWVDIQSPECSQVTAALNDFYEKKGITWEPGPNGKTVLRGTAGRDRIEKFAKFIEGMSFERWVYGKLKDSAPGLIHSFRAAMPEVCADAPEVDLVAVFGYQLVLISCTVDDGRDLVKQKAFEAMHRARQMGGDGARAVMISLAKDPGDIERDLIEDIGLADEGGDLDGPAVIPPLRVWGIDHVRKLENEFSNYKRHDLDWQE